MNEQGFAKVPGMHEYGLEILDIDILECVAFPWQLRHGFKIIDSSLISEAAVQSPCERIQNRRKLEILRNKI